MEKFFRMRDLDSETQAGVKARVTELHAASNALLSALAPRLSSEKAKSCREDLRAGEWMLVVDSLLATVVRGPVPLTSSERDLLVRTLDVTGPDPGVHFDFLGDRQGVLAAVTTLDDNGTVVPPWPGFDPSTWRPRPRAASLWGHKGGHLHGTGIPHKTTFPRSWDAQRILDVTADVARNPDEVPVQDRSGGWVTRGVRDNVRVETRLRADGTISNGYPLGGLGVHRNDADGRAQPIDGLGSPATEAPEPGRAQDRARLDDLHRRTTALVVALSERLPDGDRDRVRAGLDVGEWLFVLDDLCAALVEDRIEITLAERDEIAAAVVVGGLGDDDLPVLRDPDAMLAALTVGG